MMLYVLAWGPTVDLGPHTRRLIAKVRVATRRTGKANNALVFYADAPAPEQARMLCMHTFMHLCMAYISKDPFLTHPIGTISTAPRLSLCLLSTHVS
jgi:hypothetical protein